jgi:hypothetical protein
VYIYRTSLTFGSRQSVWHVPRSRLFLFVAWFASLLSSSGGHFPCSIHDVGGKESFSKVYKIRSIVTAQIKKERKSPVY